MANFHEPCGQHMLQEPADELAGVKAHDLDLVVVGVVAPFEAHRFAVESDQPVVGDCGFMGVASQIGDHVAGRFKRRLAVDIPAFGPKRRFKAPEVVLAAAGAKAQAAFGECHGKQRKVFTAEHLGKRLDREQELFAAFDPALAIVAERAAGDDRVHMDVFRKVTPPGVEHHGESDAAAQVALVAAEFKQCRAGRLEQRRIHQFRVRLCQGIEFVRKREYAMPVADVEKARTLALDPSRLGQRLALRAMPVAARGILYRHFVAGVASQADCAERGGTAVHDRPGSANLLARQPVPGPIIIESGAQDVCDLDCWPLRRRRMAGAVGHRRLAVQKLKAVKRRRRFRTALGQMQIPDRRTDRCMPQTTLDVVQLHAGVDQISRIAVPQRVNASFFVDAGLSLGVRVDQRERLARDSPVGAFPRKQPHIGTLLEPVGPQLSQKRRRKRHIPILGSLALADADSHSSRIDVRDFQLRKLADAKARAVGSHQHRAVLFIANGCEKPHKLVAVENLRQLRRPLGAGNVKMRIGALQRDTIKKPDAVTRDIATRPAQLALHAQMQNVILHLPGADALGTALAVPHQSGDGVDICFDGSLRQAANGHVVDHFLTKTRHG